MNRIANSLVASCIAILSVGTLANAAPDEELYAMCGTGGTNTVKFVQIGLPATGATFNEIVTLDKSTFNYEELWSMQYENGEFYILTSGSKLYTLDTDTGEGTLVGTLNIPGVSRNRMIRNPSDSSVWITFDNDSDGTDESFAQLDLANAEVDVENAVALPTTYFFNDAFFDGYGQLYGMNTSGYTGWQQWLFRVDLSTGALSPTCAGSYYPCWENAAVAEVVANPDTYQLLGSNGLFMARIEMYDTFVAVHNLGNFPQNYGCGAFTFAPNVQSEPPPPRPRPEIVMMGVCEL
jgi:hypothetical protein